MKIAVIGTGVFGYVIAEKLSENGNKVMMWGESEKKVKELQEGKLEIIKGVPISKSISFTSSYEEVLAGTDIVFIMVSAQYVSGVCKDMMPYIKDNMHFCIGSKGIEQGSCKFVHQVFEDYINTKRLAVISGPTFAVDIANNEPIAFSIASKSALTRKVITEVLSSKTIKLRKSSDMIGIELCGSIKNVIAIASGILGGLGYTDGTRSFLIVESMHDIKELIKGLGGKKKTILSFAGIGDLLMTCTSTKSRNFAYGYLLGQKDFDGAQKYLEASTVEGYYTLKSIYTLLRRKKIKMPVIDLIYGIVMKGKNPESIVEFLITK